MTRLMTRSFCCFVVALFLTASAARAGNYKNLSIAVYFRYQETQSIPDDLPRFAAQWANIEKQVKVDKVYLETTRNGQLVSEAAMSAMKKFFQDRGIKVSAGLGLTVQESNQFQSYCYSNPADRAKVKAMAEFTARFVDEIILDDFYFTNCKCELCIANKGEKSWTQARLEQMDQVSKELIIEPARAVNPKIRIIIKYPNWYESFQGLGYDLAVEPKLFDAIYTGTETRDANSGQRLQSYQSYLQTQYFNNIKPGGNQGGWIDGGRDVERYAEQFWDTFFAKVPEIVLFNSMQIAASLNAGGRGAEQQDPAASLTGLFAPVPQPDGTSYTPNMVARIAGYSAELLDPVLGKLGKPVGLAVYKPYNSVGEAYLPNYLGMIGVPLDLVAEFPASAPAVLITEASRYDKDLVAKVKKYVQGGGRVIATSGLIEALGEHGLQDIAEIRITSQRVIAKRFSAGRFGFGLGGGRGGTTVPAEPELNIVLPKIGRFENDNRISMPFTTAASGYNMAVSASYGRGMFSVLAIPDDYADIYRMPRSVLNQIRDLLGRELFVSIDAPDHVSLFAYDNRTFIVQNFQSQAVSTRVSVTRGNRLRDLLSDKTISPAAGDTAGGRRGGFGGGSFGGGAARTAFEVAVPAHSFRAFQIVE